MYCGLSITVSSADPIAMPDLHVGDFVRVLATIQEPKHGWGPASHACVGKIGRMDDDEDVFVRFEKGVWRGRLNEVEKGITFYVKQWCIT